MNKENIGSPLKRMQQLLIGMLDSQERKRKEYNPKILLGKIDKQTRQLIRGKKPDMSPQRLHNETFSRYRNRLQHQKQWIKEMKFGGASYK